MRRFTLKLPVIPAPQPRTRTIFAQTEGVPPFTFSHGNGPADFLCGSCSFKLAGGVGPSQIRDIVFRCPKCGSHNDTPYIPALERIVQEILASPDPHAEAAKLKIKVEVARNEGKPKEALAESLQRDSPELAKFLMLLEPKSAGDFYSMLGCILTFLAFLVTLRQPSSPAVVVQQYFAEQTPPPSRSRNATCPCGSGKKFKHCHGKR